MNWDLELLGFGITGIRWGEKRGGNEREGEGERREERGRRKSRRGDEKERKRMRPRMKTRQP